MGEMFIYIIGGYVLYYTGNIAYDLFIKKENKIVGEEEVVTFSLSELAEDVPQMNFNVESVEEMDMPNSYTYYEPEQRENEVDEAWLEEMKKKWEEEMKEKWEEENSVDVETLEENELNVTQETQENFEEQYYENEVQEVEALEEMIVEEFEENIDSEENAQKTNEIEDFVEVKAKPIFNINELMKEANAKLSVHKVVDNQVIYKMNYNSINN
ncbi:Uncharacterised protein [Candidatus Ornithobacterium hominis]|uniref:Uncharacterized protein n=1 Tax=Candidatus Ornithobacterium hominis TaxID=2497989 RepID=A0A383U4Y5_9FLAO|nr:hypothetical protein [Candidatus Ornithobacterium hominis]MCT7905135.1 hypothetical protein [Candidatus Ornithobacterium hominis]SZD74201.1 Uncharacterised protein [Candidatus Ornithobacterium hominis]